MTDQTIELTERSLLAAFVDRDPETLPVTDFVPDAVHVSRRELSLIVERLLMASGCPQGMWPGARDYVLETIAECGADGVGYLEDALLARAAHAAWPRVRAVGADAIDCAGGPLILVGNTVVNALLAFFADSPAGEFHVRGLANAAGVAGLDARARFHGFSLSVVVDATAGSLAIRAAAVPRDLSSEPIQRLSRGVLLSGEQWWRIYQPSNFALSEETEVSRTHTGVSETQLHYAV
ncbi:hypothetical protein [Leucobacter luti]|uniref:Uncharacterized protein n=1 Tax=Leucobacter luti TaxID=340320 RepID=A0A4Q7U1N5_9MICO|nr:hypothetical protein [Leucobacter luti]MBL3698864.1 hypothetical protein [Leucobacter luti]RZT66242.1 hypothetical protein EV139_1673 [Leucobacter luti]